MLTFPPAQDGWNQPVNLAVAVNVLGVRVTLAAGVAGVVKVWSAPSVTPSAFVLTNWK